MIKTSSDYSEIVRLDFESKFLEFSLKSIIVYYFYADFYEVYDFYADFNVRAKKSTW